MNFKDEDDCVSTGLSREMPPKPKLIMDEDGEEVTRKIAPAMVMPSLGPLPSMPSSMTTSMPEFNISAVKLGVEPFLLKTREPAIEKRSLPLTWKLPAVPVLPESYSLARSSAFVPNSIPQEVASRILDVLRERSIEARCENGKNKVRCITVQGVDFFVHLFRGRGRYGHGVIVEVQRFFGSSYVFGGDTRAILEGAEGKVPEAPALPALTRSNHLPLVSDGGEEDDNDCTHAVSSAVSPLEMVAKMMKVPGFDSQHLGLQMLQPLVTPERLSSSTARSIAVSLFEEDSYLGKRVIDYVTENSNSKTRKRKANSGVFDDDDDDEDLDILRNAALGVVSNAIIAHGDVPDRVRDSLFPALLRDLRDAEDHPNTAFLAAKCFEHLIREDDRTTELNTALQIARQVGEVRHANLFRQAMKCMAFTS